MKRALKLQVLMAGMYQIPKGKKVEFTYDNGYGLYFASSDGKTFGLAQSLEGKKRNRLRRLGDQFRGSVIESMPQERKVIVKIKG